MRFRVGLDGLKNRPLSKGDCAVGVLSDTEKTSLLSPDGFHRVQLEAAQKAGAQIGLIYFGYQDSLTEMSDFLAKWNPACVAVLVPCSEATLALIWVFPLTFCAIRRN